MTQETFLHSKQSNIHLIITICPQVWFFGFFFYRVGVDPDEDLTAKAASQVCQAFGHTC